MSLVIPSSKIQYWFYYTSILFRWDVFLKYDRL